MAKLTRAKKAHSVQNYENALLRPIIMGEFSVGVSENYQFVILLAKVWLFMFLAFVNKGFVCWESVLFIEHVCVDTFSFYRLTIIPEKVSRFMLLALKNSCVLHTQLNKCSFYWNQLKLLHHKKPFGDVNLSYGTNKCIPMRVYLQGQNALPCQALLPFSIFYFSLFTSADRLYP